MGLRGSQEFPRSSHEQTPKYLVTLEPGGIFSDKLTPIKPVINPDSD
jgi:hypothetical protein